MAEQPREQVRPDVRTMIGNPHQLVAMVFGTGLLPHAPGTAGSIVGLGLFAILQLLPLPVRIAIYVLLLVAAVWACERTGRDLNSPDHGSMVIDETLAMSLVLEFVPLQIWSWLLAFLLFRLFDVLKPWPASVANRRSGGLFVMLDDLIAAFYAVLAMGLLSLLK